jgi:hypothetical protein
VFELRGGVVTDPLKTVSFYTEDMDDLLLSRSGGVWSIGMVTSDGCVKFEFTLPIAREIKEFLIEAEDDYNTIKFQQLRSEE